MGMCALFREMGRSPVGTRVFNCDAPGQGNMDLLPACGLNRVPALRNRYLLPLYRGEITSAFCMTEPAPGAGADPTNLRTSARPDAMVGTSRDTNGARPELGRLPSWITMAVMGRTGPDPKEGATLFLVGRDALGWSICATSPPWRHPCCSTARQRYASVRSRGSRGRARWGRAGLSPGAGRRG